MCGSILLYLPISALLFKLACVFLLGVRLFVFRPELHGTCAYSQSSKATKNVMSSREARNFRFVDPLVPNCITQNINPFKYDSVIHIHRAIRYTGVNGDGLQRHNLFILRIINANRPRRTGVSILIGEHQKHTLARVVKKPRMLKIYQWRQTRSDSYLYLGS